jgi:hypothetical protein
MAKHENSTPKQCSVTPQLMRAYQRTCYRIGKIELRIGQRSPQADALLRRHGVWDGVLISAHNPRSRRMPGGWNNRMHRNLKQYAARFHPEPAVGSWRDWSEDHLFMAGPWKKGRHLGKVFRQNGIVIIRRGQPASISITSYTACT